MIEYEFITEFSRLKHVAREIERAPVIGLDLETTDLSPRYGKIRLVQFIVPGEGNGGIGNIYLLDLFELGGLGPVLDAMRATKAIWVVHNAKFEQKWLWWYYRLRLWPLFDSYRASVLIYNGKRGIKHDLDTVVIRELAEHPKATGQGGSNWAGRLTPLQKDYAAEDVYRLLRLRVELKAKLTAYGLLMAAMVEFGVVFAEGRVELNGFAIDTEKWKVLAAENAKKRARLREKLLVELPHPSGQLALPGMSGGWNVDSSVQMLQSLKRTGLKIDGTQEIVLAQHAAKRPVLRLLMDYRHVAQLVKTFGAKFLRHVESDGRIHPEYYGALVTGRYSANKSMQQIPRDARFRSCFEPPEGKRLVGADYSGIEMRLCAEISGDTALTAVFMRDEDAHKTTAAVIMNIPLESVTKDQRQAAKPVNFGLIYGMMPKMLVLYAMSNYGVTLTKKQAQLYRERYFERYQGIEDWHARVLREGERNGFSRTLSGRIRYLDPNENHNEFFNCLDAETEALTARGWVRGMELEDGDVLLTKCKETGKLEWQCAEIKKWPDYEGPLIEFKSRSFSAVSTPDHRWLVTDKSSGQSIEKLTKDISLYGDHRIHRTGEYDIDVDREVNDARLDEIRLIGWFLTDASYHERRRVRSEDKAVAVIHQSERGNPEKVAQIDALLGRLGLIEDTGRYVEKVQRMVAWLLPEDVSAELHFMFPERKLTMKFMMSLCADELHVLLDTMLAGCGTVDESGKTSFCTGAADKAGLFQILCTLCGIAASVHERDMSCYSPESPLMLNTPKAGIVYYVNLLRRTRVQVLRRHRRDFVAKMPVWCPIVPNTFFIARRNNQVFVTGNTPVQGSGGDALKTSLAIVQDRLDERFGVTPPQTPDGPVAPVHHVHDEIILESEDDYEMVTESEMLLHDGMKEGMEKFMRRVPVVVEPSNGQSWADIH